VEGAGRDENSATLSAPTETVHGQHIRKSATGRGGVSQLFRGRCDIRRHQPCRSHLRERQYAKFANVDLSAVAIDDANIDGLKIFGHDIQALIRAELRRSKSD
jgi:hypothetical protein